MSNSIIVWLRADLRLHDNPALAAAVAKAEHVVPVFIIDDTLLSKKQSSNRNRFLIECLADLKKSMQSIGGDLVIRHGSAVEELLKLAKETASEDVFYIADYTPYALARDRQVEAELKDQGLTLRSFGGRTTVAALQKIKTQTGVPYKVFTPFWRQWSQIERRAIAPTPTKLSLPKVVVGTLPDSNSYTEDQYLSENVTKGGESEARDRFETFIQGSIDTYKEENNDLGKDSTSRLSPYIHFGCISTREMETLLPSGNGADAWHRQLAWRDFYYYVLFHFPHPEREFQESRRNMTWVSNEAYLEAWKNGQTGYPVVDAAMRQLQREGWMHNRARLIVGSFLTKDLGIDWREGERHFMRWLLDGDTANNNGNWQWIASVGVDPAPLFRRLYNPSTQRDSYDPDGVYVRKYIPELKQVPDSFLTEPWKMSEEQQKESSCKIGKDYPGPIVDHKEARLATIDRYKT